MRGNFRKLTGALDAGQLTDLNYAWHEARRRGFPMDAAFDIKPAVELGATAAYKWFEEDWNWLGGWCRRNVGVFYAIAVREAGPRRERVQGTKEHFHFLIHLGSDELLNSLTAAWRKRRKRFKEVSSRRADYATRVSAEGYRGNAFTYRTKQRDRLEEHLPRLDRTTVQGAGLVLGKRYKISKNLWGGIEDQPFAIFEHLTALIKMSPINTLEQLSGLAWQSRAEGAINDHYAHLLAEQIQSRKEGAAPVKQTAENQDDAPLK